MRDISKAVGNGGANKPADVKTVQELLNDVDPALGGPAVKLVVDGLVGPKTVSAIHRFQVAQMGWGDGRVDPGKTTIQRLNCPGPVVPPKLGGGPTTQPGGGTDPGEQPGGTPPVIGKLVGKPVGRIGACSGDVQMLNRLDLNGPVAGSWAPAQPGMVLFSTGSVKTGGDGRCTILLDDGTRIQLEGHGLFVAFEPVAGGPKKATPPGILLDRKSVLKGLRAIAGG
jgi:peptidoglycan hydrolase-like protein with peptidoglycan-binding domain